MNFLNPFYLFALAAVAVPVVIHLINLQRPKKVSFSTLTFLNELVKSTIRRIHIKEYLLLALRILAVAMLAVALARPFLPPTLTGSTSSRESKAIGILIDNSASMNRVAAQGPLIEKAKDIAHQIVENSASHDRFLIASTNNNQIKPVFSGAARAQDKIDELSASNTGQYTRAEMLAVVGQLRNAPRQRAIFYVVSDGQKSQFKDLKTEGFAGGDKQMKQVYCRLIKLTAPKQADLTVTSLKLENQMISMGAEVALQAKVKNTGQTPAVNQFVSLEVEGEMIGQYPLSLETGKSKILNFKFEAGHTGDISGRVVIEGDKIDFDNSHYFVLQVPDKRSVLLINNQEGPSEFTSYLEPALQAAEKANTQLNFTEKEPSQVEASEWEKYDALIFDGLKRIPEYWSEAMQKYVQDGKGILFFPSEQGDVDSYNSFLDRFNAGRLSNIRGEYASFKPISTIADIEPAHPVFKGIFSQADKNKKIKLSMPSLYYYYIYKPPEDARALNILKAKNGDSILEELSFGKGMLIISAIGADPGWSNFPVNPLFAPLFYRTVLYASSSAYGGLRHHTLGVPFIWQGPLNSSTVTLKLNKKEARTTVNRRALGAQIKYVGKEWEPGILKIQSDNQYFKVAVNQNVMESQFDALSEEQWQAMLNQTLTTGPMLDADGISNKKMNKELDTATMGKEIWNWFLWLALLFLVTETVITRLYKAEVIS